MGLCLHDIGHRSALISKDKKSLLAYGFNTELQIIQRKLIYRINFFKWLRDSIS